LASVATVREVVVVFGGVDEGELYDAEAYGTRSDVLYVLTGIETKVVSREAGTMGTLTGVSFVVVAMERSGMKEGFVGVSCFFSTGSDWLHTMNF
jgi:hypothetical protein